MTSRLGLHDAQQLVDEWIKANGGYWPPLALLARLCEETGEVAREYNHAFGPKQKKPGEREGDVAGELADVLFILICMANQQGIDLETAFGTVLEKLRTRDSGRWGPPGGAP